MNSSKIKKDTKFHELYQRLEQLKNDSEKSKMFFLQFLSFPNLKSFSMDEMESFIAQMETQSLPLCAECNIEITTPDDSTIDLLIKVKSTFENVMMAHFHNANISDVKSKIQFLKNSGFSEVNDVEYKFSFKKTKQKTGVKEGAFVSMDCLLETVLSDLTSQNLVDVLGKDKFYQFRTELVYDKLMKKPKYLLEYKEMYPHQHLFQADSVVNAIPFIKKGLLALGRNEKYQTQYQIMFGANNSSYLFNGSLDDLFLKPRIEKYFLEDFFTHSITTSGVLLFNFSNMNYRILSKKAIRKLQKILNNVALGQNSLGNFYMVVFKNKNPDCCESEKILYLTEQLFNTLPKRVFNSFNANNIKWYITSFSLFPEEMKARLLVSEKNDMLDEKYQIYHDNANTGLILISDFAQLNYYLDEMV